MNGGRQLGSLQPRGGGVTAAALAAGFGNLRGPSFRKDAERQFYLAYLVGRQTACEHVGDPAQQRIGNGARLARTELGKYDSDRGSVLVPSADVRLPRERRQGADDLG